MSAIRSISATEEWRAVRDYEGLYEVSSLGRVRSLNRVTAHGRFRKGNPGARYRYATLARDGVNRTFHIARLVCLAFHGDPPTPLHEVNHVHGDKHDDRAEELEWVTKTRNQVHACETGLRPLGEESYQAKLTNEQVAQIRARYAAGGISHAKLALQFSISKSAISNILTRTTWKYFP